MNLEIERQRLRVSQKSSKPGTLNMCSLLQKPTSDTRLAPDSTVKGMFCSTRQEGLIAGPQPTMHTTLCHLPEVTTLTIKPECRGGGAGGARGGGRREGRREEGKDGDKGESLKDKNSKNKTGYDQGQFHRNPSCAGPELIQLG